MRILTIHAGEFWYRVKSKAIKHIADDAPHELALNNTLVVFTSVEEGDDSPVVEAAAESIIDVAGKVKASSIIIYPYAHLSSSLADPSTALRLLESLAETVSSRTVLRVYRAPFGYYKEFKLHCYGHPLSELSRTIEPGYSNSIVSERLRSVGLASGPVKIDESIRRYLPRLGVNYTGGLKQPVYDWRFNIVYDTLVKDVAFHMGTSPEEVSYVSSIPLGSLLVEMGGESMTYRGLLGEKTLLRLTGFNDLLKGLQLEHSIVAERVFMDPGGAGEFIGEILGSTAKLYFDDSLLWLIHGEKGFKGGVYEDPAQGLGDVLTGIEGGVKLVGLYRGERVGLAVSAAEARLEGDHIVVRLLPVLSLERYLLYLLDKALSRAAEGSTPSIPLWISPVQVRVIPVKPEHAGYADKVAGRLAGNGFRVDIDARSMGLGRRIRDAGKQWIPYIVIIGSREAESNTLNVRVRRTNDQFIASIDEFIGILNAEMNGHVKNPVLKTIRLQ